MASIVRAGCDGSESVGQFVRFIFGRASYQAPTSSATRRSIKLSCVVWIDRDQNSF